MKSCIANNALIEVAINSKILEWLQENQWIGDNGNVEEVAAIVCRKLEKLMKLESQGY